MPEETPQISNAFTRMLQEHNKGASLGELSEAMQKCVAAARENGGSAEIKYSVKFTPAGDTVLVVDKIELKLPLRKRKGSTFFATEDNNLVRNNPEQRDLPLREVPQPETTELKEAPKLAAVNA